MLSSGRCLGHEKTSLPPGELFLQPVSIKNTHQGLLQFQAQIAGEFLPVRGKNLFLSVLIQSCPCVKGPLYHTFLHQFRFLFLNQIIEDFLQLHR